MNGTSAVPNSDVPSWVVTEAQAAATRRGQAVDVNNRFTIPVEGAVSGTNPFTAGQQTGVHLLALCVSSFLCYWGLMGEFLKVCR